MFYKLFCRLYKDNLMRTPYCLFPIKDYKDSIEVDLPVKLNSDRINSGAFHARLTKEAVIKSDLEQSYYFIKSAHDL